MQITNSAYSPGYIDNYEFQVAMEVQAAESDKLDEAVGGESPQKPIAAAVTGAGVQATSRVTTSDAETQAL